MAEIVLSAFLSVIFEKLASAALEKLAPYNEINSEVKKLQRSLFQIRDVLADASQKEITDRSVKRWLNGLQHLAYDIDDVLDELATEAMHRELTDEAETHTSKVIKFFSTTFSKHSSWTRTMKDKMNGITTKLQDLIEEKDALGLMVKEETRSKNINRKLQSSVFDPSSIVGRHDEKEVLVRQLLLATDEACDQNYSIVPIVGMGGVGKTTLARLLYDEQQVKDHFELKAWVCVSDEFDSFAISKVIVQSVAGVNKEFEDLNLLQEYLRNHLSGKRFLLVLDDVWSESYEDWETLVGPFHACAPGSKIIMTTRKNQLLRKLGYNHLNQQLESLSDKDALSLLSIHALGVNNFDSHLSLKRYGEGIVKKCDGLPLALVALGRLLRTKRHEEEYWEEVLNSEIWNLKDEGGILPALRLSFHDLSAQLKQVFAYSSLFPKDFLFDKEDLVLLWIAEGFVQQPTSCGATKENLGYEYFDELLLRSFFLPAPNSESLFVMHDLINDLATSVASGFFARLDIEKGIREESLKKCRHMSFVRETFVTYNKFEAFKIAKGLRTLLATSVEVLDSWDRFYLSDKTLADLLPKVPLLRVLCLGTFKIKEVPESIGTLRHLRYLNLSRADIKYLPENICSLYNLETLIVFGCRLLAKLPNNLLTLKKLRHLDIGDTPLLDKMPLGIDELKSLQTLSKIIIGDESGFEISKLEDFGNLCGKISIVGLDKVQNAINAHKAHFAQKRISELEVIWSDVSDGSRDELLEEEVLKEIKPHNKYLKQLKIGSYGGIHFPHWVGDPSFIHLKHVAIRGCKKCTSLPPLGQLPSLKELFIEGLDGVKTVGLELLGTSLAFTSLKILSFVDMPGWEKWSTNIGVAFPCLQELVLTNCLNLSKVSLEALPSLNVLKIDRCENGALRGLVHVASSVTKLEIKSISGLNDEVWKGVIKYLGAVEELTIQKCNEIRYLCELEASKVLVNLRELKVWDCNNMEHINCTGSIEKLSVWSCTSITIISFPKRGEKLKSLLMCECNGLLETEWGRKNINIGSNMPMLENAVIGWPYLKSITDLNYLVHLTTLRILDCEKLESFPYSELPNMSSLTTLEIRNCPSMDPSFPCGFWPPKLQFLGIGRLKNLISNWGPQSFPTSLVSLRLYGGSPTKDDVSSFSHLSHLLPPSLTSLLIEEFERLESVSMGLQHLTSLQHLTFIKCPNMMQLPQMLLPSLLSLKLGDCPNLNERCSPGGYYWHHISHIPQVFIGSISHL